MNEFKIDNISFKPGIRLIEASAGTGKTFSISQMFVKAILEKKNIRKIAAITYTEAATAELKKRLREVLVEELKKGEKADLIEAALKDFDLLTVSTIHGFCKRVLGTFPVETDTPVRPEFIEKGSELKDESAMDFWKHEALEKLPEKIFKSPITLNFNKVSKVLKERVWDPGKIIIPDINDIKSLGEADNITAVQRHCIEYSRERFEEFKETLGHLTFDDLPGKLSKSIKSEAAEKIKEEVGNMYDVVFVDEFQDSDPLMAEIFDALFRENDKTALFYIGDPKQSIFGFRNADIYSYLAVERKIEETLKLTLNNNYRSTKQVVNAVNRIFTINHDPFNIDSKIKYNEVTSKNNGLEEFQDKNNSRKDLNFWSVSNDDDTVVRKIIDQNVVLEIKRLLSQAKIGDRSVKPSDIAIFVNANKDSVPLKDKLETEGIPAIISSSVSVFQSKLVKDLTVFLNAVVDHRNLSLIKGALFTMLFGRDTSDCAQLDTDSNLVDKWLSKFEKWHDLFNEKGFLKMFSTASKEEGFEQTIAKSENAERNLTNLRHICELLQEYEKKSNAVPNQMLQFLIEKSKNNIESGDEYEQRLDSEEDRLVISTIYKSKGLEYKIVFIPALYKSVSCPRYPVSLSYHRENDNESVVSLFNLERELAEKELLSEKMRLCYVALTRAVYRAYFVVVNTGENFKKSVPGHLFDCEFAEIGSKILELKCPNINYEEIELQPQSDEKTPSKTEHKSLEIKGCLKFTRDFGAPFKISSYSALASRRAVSDEVDVEAVADDSNCGFDPKEEPEGFFAFKKGAHSGIILHKLFEDIDFTQNDHRDEIRSLLERNNRLKKSEEEDWTEDVQKMVEKVLSAELKDGVMLKDIANENRFNEMEFLYPVSEINSEKVQKKLEPLDIVVDFKKLKGFINGFIDLVFRKDDKYYIVDWKSNYLGNKSEDYSFKKLERAMKEANYDLQYMIYAVALHKHLAVTIKNYSFKKHFGGICYIFLRGVDEKGENGIYFKELDESIVTELANCFEEGKR